MKFIILVEPFLFMLLLHMLHDCILHYALEYSGGLFFIFYLEFKPQGEWDFEIYNLCSPYPTDATCKIWYVKIAPVVHAKRMNMLHW